MTRVAKFIYLITLFFLSCSSQEGEEMILQRFQSYRNALNNHDKEKALTYLAEDFKLVFVDFDMTMTKDQVVDVLGWDVGANGKVTHGELHVSENTISGTFTEQNDFLKLINIPQLKAKIIYKFGEDGLIKEQLYQALPDQPSFLEKMKPAINWAAQYREEELAIIYPNNQMLFNEEMAKRWVVLLKDWRKATSKK